RPEAERRCCEPAAPGPAGPAPADPRAAGEPPPAGPTPEPPTARTAIRISSYPWVRPPKSANRNGGAPDWGRTLPPEDSQVMVRALEGPLRCFRGRTLVEDGRAG